MAYAGLMQNQGAPTQEQMGDRCWPGDTSDPYAVLAQVDQVYVVEAVKGMEVLTGFETGNKYKIVDARSGCDLFLAVEQKGGFMGAVGRNMLDGDNRSFNMKIGMLHGGEQPPTRFAHLERPYQCTCCCMNRPVSFLKDPKTGASQGGIVEPFAPCRFKLVLFDAAGNHYGEMDRCCTALCCFGCPCGCQSVEFEVNSKSGEKLAKIKKHFRKENLISQVAGVTIDADTFSVTFSPQMDPQQKMQAISTAIFMDFAYFTKGGSQSQSGASAIGGALGGEEGAAWGALAGFAFGAISEANKPKVVEW